jgi:hypothetical protein
VLRGLRAWLQGHSRDFRGYPPDYPEEYVEYGFRSLFGGLDLDRELGVTRPDNTVEASRKYAVEESILIDERAAGLRPQDWLGHNGIHVSTNLEQRRYSYQNRVRLNRGEGVAVLGAVCLFDELRPDVSVSRDTLRDLSFEIRSALHLAVRRAAAVHLNSAEGSFAAQVMQWELLSDLPLRDLTAGQIIGDPLRAEWGAERIIPARSGEKLSLGELRARADDAPVELRFPTVLWSNELNRQHSDWDFMESRAFYDSLQLGLAELGLDLEITLPLNSWSSPEVTVRSGHEPPPRPGLAALPPFAMVRYESAGILVAPRCPVNLRHPIAGWFAENGARLNTDYPALFAQFKRALAMVANLRYESAETRRELAGQAAELLNATLDRIRRSLPGAPAELSAEVFATESGQLSTQR